MKSSAVVGVVALIAIVAVAGAGAWYFYSQNSGTGLGEYANTPAGQENQGSAPAPTASAQNAGQPQTVTVNYNGSSFNPSSVTIRAGDTVMFTDSSGSPMWVASGVHPTHTVYDGTDRTTHCAASYAGPVPFDECRAGTDSYSFTFTKAGTWPYHNHVSPDATGQVIVQ